MFNIFKSSIGLSLLKKGITILTGIIFMILMTRFLGPEKRGEYAYILNTVNIVATVFNLGISLVLPNFIRNNSDFTTDDFLSLSFYQFLFNLFLALILINFGFSLNYCIIFFLSCTSIFSMQINNISIINIFKVNCVLYSLSYLISVLVLLFIYLNFNSNLLYVCVAFVIKDVFFIILTLKFLNFKLLKFDKNWLLIIKAGIIPMLTTALISLNYRLDVLMLDYHNIDFYLIGIFATGLVFAEYSWIVPDIFKDLLLSKNTVKDEISLLNISLRLSFTIVLFIALFFFLFGKSLIKLLFGIEYLASYDITVLMFLAVPFIIYVKLIGTLFIVHAKWNLYFFVLLISVLINLILCYFFIIEFGYKGAAFASIVAYGFTGFYFIFWYNKNYNIKVRDIFFIKLSDIKLLKRMITK